MAGIGIELAKRGSTEATRLPLLDAIVNDLVNARGEIEISVRELDCLADRVFGPVPTTPADTPKRSESPCAAVALSQAFEDLVTVRARLEAVTARLRQLA